MAFSTNKNYCKSFLVLFVFLILGACHQNEKPKPGIQPDFCNTIHRDENTSLSEELRPLDSLMKIKTGAFVLEEGDAAMIARAWLSEYAEKSIDIQYFIFSLDNIGLIACDYLVRAADRGVKVRILVDDIMVEADASDIMALDIHPNIEIKIYNPGTNLGKNILQKASKLLTNFQSANQRMHNKTFIVDNKAVITGGRNIADEYFDYDHEYNFRDRDVFLIGKICTPVQSSFQDFWMDDLSVPVSELLKGEMSEKFDKNQYSGLHQYACNPDNFWPQVRKKISDLPLMFNNILESGKLIWVDSAYFISDIPGKTDFHQNKTAKSKTTETLMDLVKKAKKSIDIQSPYLVTTKLSRDLFNEAIKRGVKIRVLTNSLASTDNLEAFSGYQRDRTALLNTGVRIFEFRPDAACRLTLISGELQKKLNFTPVFGLHAKTMVIDGEIAVIGTFNLDPRSANLNTECITIFHSQAISSSILDRINDELKPENAWETSLAWNPDHNVSIKKRAGTFIRKVIPKDIL